MPIIPALWDPKAELTSLSSAWPTQRLSNTLSQNRKQTRTCSLKTAEEARGARLGEDETQEGPTTAPPRAGLPGQMTDLHKEGVCDRAEYQRDQLLVK